MLRLTSLILVEERLLEAEYFAVRLRRLRHKAFQCELNAFLSAARSVTFLLQKEFVSVPGFKAWWDARRAELAQDRAARFFLELRNFSQKQGRVSLAGTALGGAGTRRWTYQFAGTSERVPPELLNRDVADCCREHLSKLARLVLACTDEFPFHSCPKRALTLEGAQALGIDVADVEEALGYPRGFTSCGENDDLCDRFRLLGSEVDGLDFSELRRLAQFRPTHRRQADNPSSQLAAELLHSLVNQIESKARAGSTDDPIIDVLAEQILKKRQGD